MIFRFLFVVFVCLAGVKEIRAQNDTVDTQSLVDDTVQYVSVRTFRVAKVDSAALAQAKHIRDSITWFYLKPDPKRKNLFVAEMLHKHIVTDYTFLSQGIQKAKKTYEEGKLVHRHPTWELFVLLMLITAFAILKIVFGKQMELIFQAFYDDRAFAQINKEENVFSSWYFLFSYLLFSLFIGFFIYILFERFSLEFPIGKFVLFLLISFFFALFIGLKILSLRFIGYFFRFQRLTREYINSIYLSFFNVSLFFIPLIICFTLSITNNNWIVWGGLFVVAGAFGLQLLRIAVHILTNYKLSKFYLILYLCTFELCPIIIIVKALNI